MYIFFLIAVAAVICVFMHLIGLAITAAIAGARVEGIHFTIGPKLFEFKIRNLALSFGPLPFGGHIKTQSLAELHPLKWAFAACGGSIVLILFSMLLIGADNAIYCAATGFEQIFDFVVSPRVKGADLLVRLWKMFVQNSFMFCVGVLACKIAAFNLLPHPMLNGFDILYGLISSIIKIPEKVMFVLINIAVVGIGIFLIEIVVAIVSLF